MKVKVNQGVKKLCFASSASGLHGKQVKELDKHNLIQFFTNGCKDSGGEWTKEGFRIWRKAVIEKMSLEQSKNTVAELTSVKTLEKKFTVEYLEIKYQNCVVRSMFYISS